MGSSLLWVIGLAKPKGCAAHDLALVRPPHFWMALLGQIFAILAINRVPAVYQLKTAWVTL
jgi:hypothetical protein